MEREQIEQIALMRAAVGHLGEKTSFRWWGSSFCGLNASAFLSPIFTRTELLARYQGVIAAAAIVHDDRIGVGRVYHLFRLPEEMEQTIHRLVGEGKLSRIEDIFNNFETAREFLSDLSSPIEKGFLGPVRVGQIHEINSNNIWKEIAAIYFDGFQNNREVFPFFSNRG